MRDVAVELKRLRLHGMAGAWGDLLEQGRSAGLDSARWLVEHLLQAEGTDRAMRLVSRQTCPATDARPVGLRHDFRSRRGRTHSAAGWRRTFSTRERTGASRLAVACGSGLQGAIQRGATGRRRRVAGHAPTASERARPSSARQPAPSAATCCCTRSTCALRASPSRAQFTKCSQLLLHRR